MESHDWKLCKKYMVIIGAELNDEYRQAQSTPDVLESIKDSVYDFVNNADVVISEIGQFALAADGQYLPLEMGQWSQMEKLAFENVGDDNDPPLSFYDALMQYNARFRFAGLNWLLYLSEQGIRGNVYWSLVG
jgi:hypothetical protein